MTIGTVIILSACGSTEPPPEPEPEPEPACTSPIPTECDGWEILIIPDFSDATK